MGKTLIQRMEEVNKKGRKEIEAEVRTQLQQHRGGEKVYQHSLMQRCFFTEGFKDVITICEAFWLGDVVASYVPNILRLWETDLCQCTGRIRLELNDDGSATGKAEFQIARGMKMRRWATPFLRQHIPCTDFPLSDFRFGIGPRSKRPIIESLDEVSLLVYLESES
jgi:hypothetical protein